MPNGRGIREPLYNDLFNPPRDPLVLPDTGPFIPVLDSEISELEVHTAIKNIKAAKATGADGVPPGILKLFSPTWIRIITTVFNSVFNSGIFYPREWATVKLFNVYKEGPRKDKKKTIEVSASCPSCPSCMIPYSPTGFVCGTNPTLGRLEPREGVQ